MMIYNKAIARDRIPAGSNWKLVSRAREWQRYAGCYMKSRDKILDISVAVLLLLCLFWALGNVLYIYFISENKENALLAIQSLPPLLIGIALITCLILALWLIFGRGVESRLWNWLPPFVFFRHFGRTGRKALVVLLILGTLIGMIGEFLGFPAAF